ncbi:MAG: formate dehydrogenase accessory protein FdhE [Firmicutes bacterium]|nr:formate dehydrogenase accessory protein FdhE [Bacillota bacterium]
MGQSHAPPMDEFFPGVEPRFRQILAVQRRYQEKIRADLPVEPMERLGGNYALECEKLPLSALRFREVLLHLAPVIAEMTGIDYAPLLSRLDDQVLEQMFNSLADCPEQDVTGALELTVREVRLDKISGIKPEVLVPLLQAAIVPFYTSFASQQNQKLFERWQMGWCPVCGQFPVNGSNRPGDGRRVLGCWLCETRWIFPRLVCPVCSNHDSGKIHTLTLAEDKNHRVQLCSECNHYLKITDCQGRPEDCDLMLENLSTMHLDVLAQQDGFRPASGHSNAY